MSRSPRVIAVGLLLATVALAAPTAPLTGAVLTVSDGDTFTVQLSSGSRITVRMLGIDAPEIKQAPWGTAARAHLVTLLKNQTVRLTLDGSRTDRYGRTLAHTWVGKTLVGYEMTRAGHALLYPSPTQYTSSYRAGVAAAMVARVGLWASPRLPISPKDFRAGLCRGPARTSGAIPPGVSCAPKPSAVVTLPPAPRATSSEEPYYPNCAAARAAGVAPMGVGEPGYRSRLDRDGDGIACE